MRSFIAGLQIALAAVLAAIAPTCAAKAEQGNWVLTDIRQWAYQPKPDPGPRDFRYEQQILGSGISFTLLYPDADNKIHPHRLWMGWSLGGSGNLGIRPGGSKISVTVNAEHSGDLYTTGEFYVRAGDYPRSGPSGWRTGSELYPGWGYRTDPVLTLVASNGVATGSAEIAFPSEPAAGSEPFTILFHTGMQGTAGTEYVYQWQAGPAPATPPVAVPPDVLETPPGEPAAPGVADDTQPPSGPVTPGAPETVPGAPAAPGTSDEAKLPPGTWVVEEGPWKGTWTRRPDGRTIDATWRNEDTQATARDVLRIERQEGQLILIRRDSMDGYYVGAVTCDGRRIDGWASWYPPGWLWKAEVK